MFVLCWFLQISLSCRVCPMLPVSQFLWIVNSVVLSKVYWYLLGTPMWCVCLLVKVVLLSSNCNCWAFLCNLKSVNVSCSVTCHVHWTWHLRCIVICCLLNYYLFTLWSDLYLLFVQLVLFTLWSDLYLLFVQLVFVYIVEWPLFVVCSTIFVYIVEWPVLHYFARGNIPSICNVNVNVNLDISCMYN